MRKQTTATTLANGWLITLVDFLSHNSTAAHPNAVGIQLYDALRNVFDLKY